MEINDIVALAHAGFTAEQIAKMNLTTPVAPIAPIAPIAPLAPVAPVAPVAPAVPIVPLVAPVAPVAPAVPIPIVPVAPQGGQELETARFPNPIDAIMESVNRLTETVQANAISNTNMPAGESTEDLLADIIAPKQKKED